MTGLECGHRFCTGCWGEYLTTKIMEEGVGQTIACAAHACDILVDDASVMRLVKDSKVKLKYQHLITNSFVEVKSFLDIYTLLYSLKKKKKDRMQTCIIFSVQQVIEMVSFTGLQ